MRSLSSLAEGLARMPGMAELAGGIAHELKLLEKDGEIAIASSARLDTAACLLAAWEVGRKAVLLPNLPSSKGALLDPTLAARAVLGRALHPNTSGLAIDLDHLPTGVPPLPPSRVVADAEPLVVLHTSGTTGKPEQCEKSAGQLFGEAELLLEYFSFNNTCVVMPTAPLHHIYGLLFGMLVPLRAGSGLVLAAPLHVDAMVPMLVGHQVTDLVSVPAHLAGLAALPRGALAPVRRIFSSAAPLPSEVAAQLRDHHGIEVIEVLGSTETGGIASRNSDGAWCPLPKVSVTQGSDGCIEIRSPFLALKDQPVFQGRDLIEMAEGGTFHHLGRSDGVVKVAGKRTSLQEIEARTRTLSGVSDVAAVVLPSQNLRGTEVGLVVAGDGWSATTLRQALGEFFDPVVVPRRYRFVSELPRHSNGKIPRAALLALFDAERLQP